MTLLSGFTISPFWASSSSGITMDVCSFDSNGDEYLDVVFAVYKADGTGELQLYLNDNGTLHQTPDWISGYDAAYQSVCVGDVDNDGDMDIVAGTVRAGTNYAYNCLYINNGYGQYSQNPVWLSSDDLDTINMQLIDIDSDGWLELLSANHNARILLYENNFAFGGLFEQQPVRWFGDASLTSFAVSQLPIEDINSELVDIICANPSESTIQEQPILVNKVFQFSENTLPPVQEVWACDGIKPEAGYWYQCIDVNGDSFLDWIASYQAGIIYGEYDAQLDTYTQFELTEIENYPGLDEYNFKAELKVYAADLIPEAISPGAEIYVCNRGLRRFVPGVFPVQHEMHQSEDLLLSLNLNEDNLSASVVWQSAMKVPTTSVSFCDINRSGIVTAEKTFSVTIPNQMFVLEVPFERILSVSVDGVQLQSSDYHYDRNAGIISIIGDYSDSQMIVTYEISSSLDAVCSTTEYDVVLLNEY